MDQNIDAQLKAQEEKLEAILLSVHKTEKYIKASVWITVIMFLLPFLAILFVVPMFIRSYTSSLEGLL